jgi:hypothetical protein
MKIIIHDANVLIDLVTSDLLEPWCKLNFRMMTTSLVWREVNRKGQKPLAATRCGAGCRLPDSMSKKRGGIFRID